MLSTTFKTIGAACTVAATLAVVAVPAASAKHRDDIRIAGTCDAGSSSKLKAKADHGRLKVEFEVDQNVSGVVWDVTLTQDGKLFFDGQRTTRDPSGSFSVERRVWKRKSSTTMTSGTIAAVATRAGETCTATLTVADTKVKPTTPATPTKTATDPATANGHDVNDDNGNDPAGHDVNDDHGNHDGDPAHDAGADNSGSGHHGNDD